jgi:RimJ/RimL family protein N-acetyltransferase
MTRQAFENRHVRLDPLALDHVDALVGAATADRSSFDLAPVPRDRSEMVDYVERALLDEERGYARTFAIVAPSRQVVGSIRLMSLEWWTWPSGPVRVAGEPRRFDAGDPPDVAEIGHAWLTPSAQRTAINSASCLLLLTHCFEVWRVHRVVLKTDERNARSRTAIERLGGRFEGILRAHLPSADGLVRNTAMFSIVPDEWTSVRKRLERSLG